MLAKILRRIPGYLRSFLPNESERRFVAENRAFWDQYWRSPGNRPPAKSVLIEATSNPIINLCNASFGAITCAARGLRPIFFVQGLRDRSTRRMLSSYHPDALFIHTTDFRYLLARVTALVPALRAWLGMRTPRDVLEFRIDGIKFGDIIYDNTLLFGYATLSRVDLRVLAVLHSFFTHREFVRDIIGRYSLDSCVLAHTIGMLGGTFSRYLLKQNIEVLNRVGSHEILVKKYQTFADVGFYPAKPERPYFDYMMNLPDNVVLPLADAYLDERHNQRISHIAVELAFDRKKRFYESSEAFCAETGLDPGKKTVFVMLHAFNDHPHSHFARPLAFQDYFEWFEQTLAVAQTVESVNWVFKEHPAAGLYPIKDVDLTEIFSRVRRQNILFLDANANFNAMSIRFLADAIVTCLGTAGMEYACVGIPCVLAGESPYSGFGFTTEPESAGEYFDCLRHLDTIGKLSPEQIKAAKITMYFELPMMHSARYWFCPKYGYEEIIRSTPDQVLGDAAKILIETDSARLRQQVETLSDFLKNPDYTQYLNLEQYGFMSESVPKPASMPTFGP